MSSVRRTIILIALLAACSSGEAGSVTSPPAAAEPSTTTTSTVPTPAETTTTTTTTLPRHVIATADPPGPRRLVIHAVGDVSFAPDQNAVFRSEGYEIAWSGLDGLFTRDDLTIANLECTASELGALIDKKYSFRCPVDSLGPMRAAGVDVVTLANNHAGDAGADALLDARRNLIVGGIAPVGAGDDLAAANRAHVVDIGGHRVAVVGLATISGEVPGWFATDRNPGAAPAYGTNHVDAVAAAAAAADIVIVTIHWGEEGAPGPTSGDRFRAREMIAAGADVIVGHHPHRLQALEVLDGAPVFWSMGNFVWPDLGPIPSKTGVAEIVVEPDGSVSARIIPADIVSHGHPVLLGRPDYSLWVNSPLR
jgi:hypothetical protein